jgi:hypothetical protein
VIGAPRAATLAAFLALAGCSRLPVLPHQPSPPSTEGDWAKLRDRYTRRALLYDGFKHRATATATLLTKEVREARARRLADWLGWTQVELDARLAQEQTELAEGEEFFVSLYTADPRENDLDATRPIWRVAVKVSGEDVLARRMTAAERNVNSVGLFPYVGPFDIVYRVILPPAPGGALADREFVLELASGQGKMTLDFAGEGGPVQMQAPVPPP